MKINRRQLRGIISETVVKTLRESEEVSRMSADDLYWEGQAGLDAWETGVPLSLGKAYQFAVLEQREPGAYPPENILRSWQKRLAEFFEEGGEDGFMGDIPVGQMAAPTIMEVFEAYLREEAFDLGTASRGSMREKRFQYGGEWIEGKFLDLDDLRKLTMEIQEIRDGVPWDGVKVTSDYDFTDDARFIYKPVQKSFRYTPAGYRASGL